ncbi:MAG: DUF255 domain-containing protein [Proteobacteria bacterium]|nr:DUF255 domain-containing protein [Pseudomonadota bacterium]
MRKLSFKLLGLLIGILFSTTVLFALDQYGLPEPGEILANIKAEIEPDVFRRGENIRIKVEINIIEGWHIYSVIHQGEDAPPPTSLTVQNRSFVKDGPAFETRPINDFDKVIGLNLSYHENDAILYQNLKVPDELPVGSSTIPITVRFQTCSDRICLPPESKNIDLDYRLEPGPVRADFEFPDRSIDPLPSRELKSLTSKGIRSFIALAALMGLASLITPCVFPMIPITISFFSNQAEGDQKQLIKLASIFALGIILTYTGTGLLMSALFGAGSALQLATNPYINLAIAFIFIVFAFSLMGFFEISLPVGIQGYFDKKSRQAGGVTGVLLMGFTFTLTAFTCTVQFVGTMLIAAAQGEWIWPLLGMLTFSSVFAFPFFLLALAPGLVKTMQGRSGAWLGRSKVVLGILELMASVKFLSNADLVWQTDLISRNTAIIIWALLFAIIIIYLISGNIRPKLKRSPGQWSVVVVFAALLVLLGRGYDDRSLGSLIDSVLPPPAGQHLVSDDFITEEEAKQVVWLTSINEALIIAEKEDKKIFVDFTGYTCVNCRWMEHNTFALKGIHQIMTKNYILVRLYTDGGDDAGKNLNLQIERFNTVALPFYVLLSNKNKVIKKFSGISSSPEEFQDFLRI